MRKSYYVYIMGNERPTLSNDLARRVCEHKHDLVGGFTRNYRLRKLLYFEMFEDIENAINREKKLKESILFLVETPGRPLVI